MKLLLALVVVLALTSMGHGAFLDTLDNDFIPGSGGTPDSTTPKLVAGYHAWFDLAEGDIDITTPMNVEWRIYEHYDEWNNGADDMPYDQCVVLQYGKLSVDSQRLEATTNADPAAIKEGCKLTRGTGVEGIRTWSITLSLANARDPSNPAGELSTLSECQGWKDSTEYTYAIHCQREQGHDHEFDAIFVFKVDAADQTQALAAVIDDFNVGVNIGNMPSELLTRRWGVAMNVLESPDILNHLLDVPIVTVIPLGTTLRYQVCISIDDASRQFFENQWSPLGMHIHSCFAEIVGTDYDNLDAPMDTAAGRKKAVSDVAGCGLATSPMKAWDEWVFKYYQQDFVADFQYLKSPNCWRSKHFEGASFQRSNHGGTSKVKLTCGVKYCNSYGFTGDDQKCWGNGAGDGELVAGYPVGCPTFKRKRREAMNKFENEIDVLSRLRRDAAVNNATFRNAWDAPRSISTTFTIQLPTVNSVAEESCFEQTTFVGLTSALTFILVLVVTTAAFLSCKIRSLSKLADRHSSTSGFSNKAFS